MESSDNSSTAMDQAELDLEYGIAPEERAVIEAIRGNLVVEEQSALF